MEIQSIQEGTTLTVSITGNLDTLSSAELEKHVKERWDGITELVFDFSAVEYVSSAGLRVVLVLNKHMLTCGTMTLRNVHKDVYEIFEMTGFDTLLTFA